jgi:hypothetical protein
VCDLKLKKKFEGIASVNVEKLNKIKKRASPKKKKKHQNKNKTYIVVLDVKIVN